MRGRNGRRLRDRAEAAQQPATATIIIWSFAGAKRDRKQALRALTAKPRRTEARPAQPQNVHKPRARLVAEQRTTNGV